MLGCMMAQCRTRILWMMPGPVMFSLQTLAQARAPEGRLVDRMKALLRDSLWAVGLDVRRVTPAEVLRFKWIQNLGIRTVVDIGANVGQFSLKARKLFPEAKIYAFEPLRLCYERLVHVMHQDQNFAGFNHGLGDDNFETEIFRSKFSPASSLRQHTVSLVRNFPYSTLDHVERVQIRTLDNVAQNLAFQKNILVKIDVQGYEDKVLDGGRKTMSEVKLVIVETSFEPLYLRQPLFRQIYDRLTDAGFTYGGCMDRLLSPLNGRVLQEDSIFLRETDRIPR